MNVYLASAFSLRDEVEFVASKLRKAGHEVTVDWWSQGDACKDSTMTDKEWYDDPAIQKLCFRALAGIRKADIVVFVSGDKPRKFNGANIEVGYAQAWNKPVFVLGVLERSALYCQLISCRNVTDLLWKMMTIAP